MSTEKSNVIAQTESTKVVTEKSTLSASDKLAQLKTRQSELQANEDAIKKQLQDAKNEAKQIKALEDAISEDAEKEIVQKLLNDKESKFVINIRITNNDVLEGKQKYITLKDADLLKSCMDYLKNYAKS